jgi:hypothetical protein
VLPHRSSDHIASVLQLGVLDRQHITTGAHGQPKEGTIQADEVVHRNMFASELQDCQQPSPVSSVNLSPRQVASRIGPKIGPLGIYPISGRGQPTMGSTPAWGLGGGLATHMKN